MAFSITYEKPAPAVLLPQGHVCKARVDKAEFGFSQAGNEMATLNVHLLDEKGETVRVNKEYLVSGEKSAWKVSEFLASTGLASEEGAQVELNEETLVGAVGTVRVTRETYVDTSGSETEVNRIGKWLPPKEVDGVPY